ncbi:MAG: outer membrane protein assembly factor BamA [Gammaproteobacteria bacterium]|nr:outer membrane protein assembly factor BamA [Gammaproteobacteria bacterium]
MKFPSSLVRACALVACLFLGMAISADYSFTVEDIRLKGLMRVSAGTVFNELTLDVNDTADPFAIRQLIRELFATGYFDDVRVSRDGDVIVVEVVERPAIDSITIEGNKAIKTEDLLDGLAGQGLRDGEIFEQSTLDRVSIELRRQYVAQGQYTANITTEIVELARNRVAIKIEIEEGRKSGIRQIEFVGNNTFTKKQLLEAMELKEPTLLGFLRGNNQYSRQKLQGDLESLQAFYRDRGYVEFQILSTQVSMTPDRKQVYLTISVTEGDKFTVDDVDILGDLDELDPDELRQFIGANVRRGEIFSSANVTRTEEILTAILSNRGYTFGAVDGVPEIKENALVDINFVVNTGRRTYVRRINFLGNTVTQDSVLRREMRQLESAWASTHAIDLSKARLERLGFFSDVNLETPAVDGTDDQIDVTVTVEEQPTGSISGTVGYQKYSGLLLGASFEQSNIGGTGNSLAVGINWSDYSKSANLSYFNPYFTESGVSRGVSVYFQDTNFSSAYRFTRFSTSSFGAGLNFGFPISEVRRLQFSGRVEWTDITQGYNEALEISDFVDAAGAKFLNYKIETLWAHTTLDRPMFAMRGSRHIAALEFVLPGSDLQFLRATYKADWYIPLRRNWSLHFRGNFGGGRAYGNTTVFPFFENFYAGGFGSVRGYERHTLGPRSTPSGTTAIYYPEGRPFGGNILIEGSAELVFPMPFLEQVGQIRSVAFLDAGNVFSTNCPEESIGCFEPTAKELRYSFGIGVSWITRMGPMSFSLSLPFNNDYFDETEGFSFEVGQSF